MATIESADLRGRICRSSRRRRWTRRTAPSPLLAPALLSWNAVLSPEDGGDDGDDGDDDDDGDDGDDGEDRIVWGNFGQID